MKTIIVIGLFVLFLVSVQFSSAKTVDEIIDKYIAARGGKEKLAAVNSLYMEGVHHTVSGDIPARIYKEQDKLSRKEFDLGGQTSFELVTDKEAWVYSAANMQAPQLVAAPLGSLYLAELDIAGPLVDYARKGHKVELVGKEIIDDTTCYKIRLFTAAGDQVTYWIQADNYLLLRSSSIEGNEINYQNGDQHTLLVTKPGAVKRHITYRDYRRVNGVLFPHTLATTTENRQAPDNSHTSFNIIEVNGPVQPEWYQPA